MRNALVRTASSIVAVTALGLLAGTGAVQAAPMAESASSLAPPCRFYETGGEAYYNHCDTGSRTDVEIRVHTVGNDYNRCVRPGVTHLGSESHVDTAFWTGHLCRAG